MLFDELTYSFARAKPENVMCKNLRRLGAIPAIALLLILLALASGVRAQDIESCLAAERNRNSVTGFADFRGESWDGTEFDVGIVPGTQILVVFDDRVGYLYGGEQNAVVADNLFSLQNSWAKELHAPYPAVRRTDGSIIIITGIDCQGWMILNPTIIPDAWETSPLAECLTGAYRATDNLVWETNQTITANFDDESEKLHSNFALGERSIVAEFFEGFKAVTSNGAGHCNYTNLEEVP